MDRRSFLLAPLALGLGAAAQAAGLNEAPTSSVAPDIARILNRGRLIVAAYRGDMPPFLYTDQSGKPGGIDVELAADIAARLNVRLDYSRIATSFDALPVLVAERKADVAISYLSRTLRRAAMVRFTQPYVRLRQTVMVNRVKTAALFRGGDRVEVLNDPAIAIGVEDGSSYVDFAAERFPRARLLRFATNDEAITQLLKGALHAVLMDEAYARALNAPQPGVPRYAVPDDWVLHVKTILLPGAADSIAMVVHRDDANWLAWLDQYIADSKDDGSLERIVTRHMGGRPG